MEKGSSCSMAQQGCREYRVRMCRAEPKKFHVMRFKPPHKCDLEKLHHPTLERLQAGWSEPERPEVGEGSEFGRQWREEARRRKRGYAIRKKEPDDQPWVLREKKKGGKHFVSRKEGSVNTSSSYYILTFCEDGVFEALPVSSWYDFVPPVKYDYLNADEAEEKFEQRHKTLNYFSVMLSRKLREEQGEGGEGGEGGGGGGGGGGGKKKDIKKKGTVDLYLTDSDSNISHSSDEEGGSSLNKKGKSVKKSRRRVGKKRGEEEEDDEAGEETDEGDMEGQEVDYMSRSSSESEEEFKAKKAVKEVPKDDEEVDRQEEGDIDRGFTDSSSSSEDELTEAGKEIQALMKKQTGGDETSEEEEPEEHRPPKLSSSSAAAATGSAAGGSGGGASQTVSPRPATPSKSHSKGKSETSKKEKKKATGTSTPQKRPLEQQPHEMGGASSGAPPSKKAKGAESTSTITEEEVRRYLSRKPITSKELLKKFTSKKPDIDKSLVPEMLSRIIKKMPNVEEKRIEGKFYLSLKTGTSE